MILWLSILTLAAVWTAVVVSMLFSPKGAARATATYDVAIYKDQLEELERDVGRGLIAAEDAAAARVEVSRKLIAASEKLRIEGGEHIAEHLSGTVTSQWIAAAIIALFVPIVSLLLYSLAGSPDLPTQPFAAREVAREATRMASEARELQLSDTVRVLEAELQSDPSNLNTWRQLAQSQLRLGNYQKAVEAFDQAMVISSRSAELLIGKGVALVYQEGGQINADAESIFEELLASYPNDATGLYFLGLAYAQRQELKESAALWRVALANASPDWPWHARAQQQLQMANDLIEADRTEPKTTSDPTRQ